MIGRLTLAGLFASLAVTLVPPSAPSVGTTPQRADTVRLVLAPTGNEARYLVREQLARLDLPNDAVGRTTALTGTIVLTEDGRLVPDGSRIVVDLRSLASDRDRRDQYLRTRTLQTDLHPTAILVPTALRGLPAPLPNSGPVAFDLIGDFTVRGVTIPTTWGVVAAAGPGGFAGTASTKVTFEELGLEKPRLAFILSVADTIRLEYDFSLRRAP